MGFFSNLFKKSTFFESEYTDKSLMSVAQVMGAHANWKSRLGKFIDGTLGYNLDPDVLAAADDTELGRWILQSDAMEMSDPRREMLKKLHEANQELHKVASQIARIIHDGRREDISSLNQRFQDIAKDMLMLLLDISKEK